MIIVGLRKFYIDALVDAIKLETNNSNVEFHQVDLSDLSSVRHFAEKIKCQISRIDILINNAGILISFKKKPLFFLKIKH